MTLKKKKKNLSQDVFLDVGLFLNTLESNPSFQVVGRFFSGSSKGNDGVIWAKFAQRGYQGKAFQRIPISTSSSGTKEQGVDEKLHAYIYRCIATHSKSPRVPGSPKPVIMLVTGDGSEKDPCLNFPDCVRTAISNGFAVEIWSWHNSLHDVYWQLHEQHGEDCKIIMLDEHRSSFCRQL